MKTLALAALGLAALAAPAAAQRAETPYKAVGTEPFWSVTMDARTIRYQAMEGRAITVAKPRPRPSFNGERYVTRRLVLDIIHQPCSDGMSDRRYPDTVRVTIGGRTLQGCGGTPVAQPAELLAGEWRLESIAGRPPVRGSRPTIRFAEHRLSGTTGCNSFSGRYRFENGRLTAGPMMTSKRACVGRTLQAQEQAILGLLDQRLSVTSTRYGKLVLSGRGGERLVLAK